MPLTGLSGHGHQLISILEWQLGPLGGDLLLARESEDNKYWAPEGTHMQCLAEAEGIFVSREIRKRRKCKTSRFPLVFQKDGLIWQSKPHSHQWSTREGSQQPHTVTRCRCCRKSDRGHFHHAVTTSYLESAFPSVPRIVCCWWRKDFPLPFVLIFIFRACGIYLIFILFSEVQKSLIFIEVSFFSTCAFQRPAGCLSSVPSSTITLPDKKQRGEGKVAC